MFKSHIFGGNIPGPNFITNGTFDADTNWDKGAGWSIGSGVATRTNTGGATNLEQLSLTIVDGASYLVIYEITAYTSGQIRAAIVDGTSPTVGTFRAATGVYKEVIKGGTGNDDLSFQATSTFAGSIDNVSIQRLF